MALDPADFSVAWGTPRKGVVHATVTHDPSGRSFGLKASSSVTGAWQAAPDPAAARSQWVKTQSLAYLTRVLYEESPEGVREALIREGKQHRDAVLLAKEFIDRVKADYPAQAHRLPTITITGGED